MKILVAVCKKHPAGRGASLFIMQLEQSKEDCWMFVFDAYGTLLDVDAATREAALNLAWKPGGTIGFQSLRIGERENSVTVGWFQ